MSGDNLKPGYTPIRELMELGRAGGDVGESKAEAMLANPALKDALATAKEAAAAAGVEPELRAAPPSESQVATSIVVGAPRAAPHGSAAAKPAAGMPVDAAAEHVAPPPDSAPAPRVLVTPRGRRLDEPTDVLRSPAARAEPVDDGKHPPRKPASIVGYVLAGAVGLIVGVATTIAFTPTPSPAPAGTASAAAAAAPVCPPQVAPPPQACPACPAVEAPPPCPTAGAPVSTGPAVRPPKPPRTAEPGATGPEILP